MEDVCSLIPETCEGTDLEVIGYNRQCYQQYQDRLKQLNSPELSSSKPHYSPHKKSVSNETRILCLPECIYCDKTEIQNAGKTEKPTKFTLNSVWQTIESHVEKLGKTSLAHKVRGFDLCFEEVKHYTSCHRAFKTEYHNFIHAEERAKSSSVDTEQACITAAHNEAFSSVLQFLQEYIIQNKVMQLSSLRLIYIDKLDECGYLLLHGVIYKEPLVKLKLYLASNHGQPVHHLC